MRFLRIERFEKITTVSLWGLVGMAGSFFKKNGSRAEISSDENNAAPESTVPVSNSGTG